MKKVTLHQVLEQVKMLTPDEQRELQKALDELLDPPPSESLEEELARKLQKAGPVITHSSPITDSTCYEKWKPVEVKGKPVSEIIIEERR